MRSVRAVAVAPLLLAFVTGCRGGGQRAHDGTPPTTAPTYQELAAKHNARLAGFTALYSSGTTELRWSDEKGKHFQKGDLELWLKPPSRVALRVSAVGEDVLWIGADEQRHWLFDLRNRDEPSLRSYSSKSAAEAEEEIAELFRPEVLLDLCGLAPLPETTPDADAPPAPALDKSRDAWTVTIHGRSGFLVRVFFDRRSLLESRIELLDDGDQVVLFSQITLDRYAAMPIDNASPAGYPILPTLINLFDPHNNNTVRLALDEHTLTGRVSDKVFTDRVFDLKLLMKRFHPTNVQGDLPEAAPTP